MSLSNEPISAYAFISIKYLRTDSSTFEEISSKSSQKYLKFYYLSSYNFLFKRFNLLKVHVKNLCCPSSESSEGLSREVKLTFFRDIKRKSNLTGNKFDFFLQKSANSNESRESTILNFYDSQCPRFSTLRNVESWETWTLRIVESWESWFYQEIENMEESTFRYVFFWIVKNWY